MPISYLNLYNFSPERVTEAFFYNVKVWEISCFYFCSYFYFPFKKKDMIKNSVVLEKYLSNEIIGCCCKFRKEIFSDSTISEELCDDYFDELKKLLIQYFQ